MTFESTAAVEVLQKKKRLKRELTSAGGLKKIRIAVLGGTTTNELVDLLELLLLSNGLEPAFYQSEYNRFFEDAVLEPEKIQAFRPDLVYIHTHYKNVQHFPHVSSSPSEFQKCLDAEVHRFESIWSSLHNTVNCQIIQSNFEHPPSLIGNHDAVLWGGKTRFVNQLNVEWANHAAEDRRLLIHDMNSVAARVGLNHWFDWNRWFSYKILTTPEANFAIARSLAAMIGALVGCSKKVLVLDLDNTLWGGVIGDDGLEHIQIGRESALAEAYTAFQEYCLSLRDRGVLLAVCSKNNEEVAQSGFTHPASVLKLEHFSAFKANWDPKHETLKTIAEELNLGLDSFVFVDDNPAERAIVRAQLPQVTVPEVGTEVALFPSIIQAGHYFETVSLSAEDLARTDLYGANSARASHQARFSNYGEYLDSLAMTAEIESFKPIVLQRVTQLINKTNQFNLTTRRYTAAEVEGIASSSDYITLYGRLVDAFGDNGLISAIIGRREGLELHLDLWIMSCRVLKREMELAMLDVLVGRCLDLGIEKIWGHFIATAKNTMVKDHYPRLGFSQEFAEGDTATWSLSTRTYVPQSRHIRVLQESSVS